MLTSNCSRGCGKNRKRGGSYLCVGQSEDGQPIEYFIKDPGIPWSYEFSRAPRIIPDENGVNHVYMWIAQGYESPWFHIEETRRFGLSRLVSGSFPIEKLTPFQSEIRCIYPRGIPQFEFVGNENEADHYPDCKVHKSNIDWNNSVSLGKHPPNNTLEDSELYNAYKFCTFAHKDISFWLANDNMLKCYLASDEFEIHFPSIEDEELKYNGHFGKMLWDYPDWVNDENTSEIEEDDYILRIAHSTENWTPAILMSLPLSHIEMPFEENEQMAERAKSAGFDVFVLPY